MRKTLTTAALVLALCCPVFAGEMNTPVAPAPPPSQPASAIQEPTTDGEMSAGVMAPTADGIMGNGAAATFVQIVLNLLALP
jgi:hypothetical protein